VIAGIWTHRDLVDRAFTFADLVNAHEILNLKEANDAAYQQWKDANGVR
jgi:hypothetical protein